MIDDDDDDHDQTVALSRFFGGLSLLSGSMEELFDTDWVIYWL